MASNWSYCGVCHSLQISKTASVWCPDCDEGLCDNCDKRHSVSRGTKNHQAIPVDRYNKLPPKILKITQTCTKHNERYQTYCQIHDCPCCHRCVIETHNRCKDLKAIDDVVQNVLSSNALTELEESLKELSENVTKVIWKKESNMSSLKTEKEKIEKDISDVRTKVNKHLDNLQGILLTELEVLDKNKNEHIRALVMRLKERETAIEELQKTLCRVKEHATELQIFLAMKGIEKDVREEEKQLKSLCSTDEAAEETHFSLEVDHTIQHLDKDVKMFGQIKTQSQPINLPFERRKDKQAQLKMTHIVTRSVKNIVLSQVKSFKVDMCINVISCALLPYGIAALVSLLRCSVFEYKMKVLGIRSDGSNEFDISLDQNNVHDLAYIPPINSLAVLCFGSGNISIQIFDLLTKKITKSIPLKSNFHGISHQSESSVVLIGDEGIYTMNLADESVKTVKNQLMNGLNPIASFNENIYYTNENSSRRPFHHRAMPKVHCCDLQGNSIWSFKDTTVLRSPHSVTVGTDGIVYVAGHDSNNIVVIQSDCSEHAELLSSADGLESPVGIDYDRTSNQLLVVNKNGKVFLYNVNE